MRRGICDTSGIVFATVGVSVMENRVEVDIPNLALEIETMELMQEHLPPELAERFFISDCVDFSGGFPNFLLKMNIPR